MLVPIDDLKPGMMLADDVILPNGAVLVNASHELSEKLIEMLRKRHIEYVQVIGDEEAEATAEPPSEDYSDEITQEAEEFLTEESDDQEQDEQSEPARERQGPVIKVTISDDGMSASLRIEPLEGPNNEVSAQEVMEALEQAGVTHGVDEHVISTTVRKWNETKRMLSMDNIARGSAAIPGKQGEFDFLVPCITDEAILAKVRKASHFWQIQEFADESAIAKPGDIVAERQPDTPPVPGKKVTGELITNKQREPAPLEFEPNLQTSFDGRSAKAEKKGLVFLHNGRAGIIELNFDAQPELTVSNDRMHADLIIHPPGPDGRLPDPREVDTLLTANSVNHGIKKDALRQLFSSMAAGECPAEPVRIAEGEPPTPGENGHVEFCFNTEYTLQPKSNADGSVDFKNLSIVHSVSEGDHLAKLHPPTKGTPGTDIAGQKIPAKDGIEAVLPFGENTAENPEDASIMIASTEGNVRYDGKSVEVSEGFVVKGHVDFSTGNVKYAKSVTVQGDVKSGFDVECGGDLEVTGTVEDSQVTVGGNVLCKHGFLGQGKGSIDAKGNVNVGFLKNQTVRSRENVVIAKESLNATIHARKTITVHGKPLSVAGGTLVARDSITVYTVGNASQIRTVLEVGLDFTLIEELKKTDQLLGEVSGNLKKLADSAGKFKHLLAIKKKLPPKEEFLYSKLKNSISRYYQQMKQLEERKKLIESKMRAHDEAFVKIEHMAMPGSVFKIGERFFVVREEISGPKVIRAVQQQIRVF